MTLSGSRAWKLLLISGTVKLLLSPGKAGVYLREISDLEPALAKSLNKLVTFTDLADRKVLFREGDEADYMFTVVSGCLKVLRHSEGRDVYVRNLYICKRCC